MTDYGQELSLTELRKNNVPDLILGARTIDAWIHEKMLTLLRPIIGACPNARWLTIGDEGQDGWILNQWGAGAVTASSLSDVHLKNLKELGYLNGIEVRALNAERLELPDASFDFVLCRQAYHHVRRAPLAFYEFMRVARLGFVLIEPCEYPPRPLNVVRTLAKSLLRRRKPVYDLFEPAGNYIYRISERDILRMSTAVQLPWFAIRTFNVFNIDRLAHASRDSLLERVIFKIGLGVQDVLSFCRLMSPGLCAVFVATSPDAKPIQEVLRAANFRIVPILKNPYARNSYARDQEARHG